MKKSILTQLSGGMWGESLKINIFKTFVLERSPNFKKNYRQRKPIVLCIVISVYPLDIPLIKKLQIIIIIHKLTS